MKCFARCLHAVVSDLLASTSHHFCSLCVLITGHTQRLLPGHGHLLQHGRFPHLLCIVRPDGPVCSSERGHRCAHEAFGGEQQRGKGGG